MVRLFRCVLALGFAAALAAANDGPRFYNDDPIAAHPDLIPAKDPRPRKIDPLYDFIYQSVHPKRRESAPALDVNTLGEVPDSSWYTNRHQRHRMTIEELRRGPGDSNPPQGPFEVIAGKKEGITPGFTIRDAQERVYFVKPDPESNPEMATAADVIGSKFFYALGYNTPENYILYVRPEDLTVRSDEFTKRDLAIILDRIPRTADGRIRLVASLRIEGKPLGPFRYTGTRSDDPNDVFPHERRRELRGLHVFAAWLNHTDTKAGNSLDVLVETGNGSFLRHYLLDFGAILGSDSDMAKNARYGHEYVLPTGREVLRSMATVGLVAEPWEWADYPDHKAVGRFEASQFHPDAWKSNYPNPAFLSRQPDDEFWAAKQVMAFTDEEIRALVETGQYSDPRAVDWITRTLIERRNRIGAVYYRKVLALDNFRIEDGELQFDDLSGLRHPLSWTWHRYDNIARKAQPIPAANSAAVPSELRSATDGSYFLARISDNADPSKTVRVYLRKRARSFEVVGIERTW